MAKLNSKRKSQAPAREDATDRAYLIGPRMNFAAAEAYKLLRTNLVFSFSGESEHRIIGVTSAFHGEGKSLTSINLAYTLAEAEKSVLLIDGDMRLSNVAKTLQLSSKPGLSNLLVGLNSVNSAIQECSIPLKDGDELTFDVIVAGDVPPNPSELLGSSRMNVLLDKLKERYDYIILDLPPVMAVADALVVSHVVDGLFVIVRKDRTTRSALAETMRQLELVDAHILGFVFNAASESDRGYYKAYNKKYKNSYYGNYYGKGR
ncbi:MAG: CpsD/CapB family tyrosine-protein kinase [Oscillospiraceae bacterium]|nr:CpsD/CapB family tyrosine-protein kinase [Oscillospiraceae bacterium]